MVSTKKVAALMISNILMFSQISAIAAPADNKSTSEFKSELKKGTTKAEVKAYFGGPPYTATESIWHYEGQFVDKIAEKIFSKCSVIFTKNDELYLVSSN